jgi:membrane fusion protein, copper/silver efflux system
MRVFIYILSIFLLAGCTKDQTIAEHAEYTPNEDGVASTNLMLTDSQLKLANITIERVSARPVGQTSVLNARLVQNEDLTEIISSRASGRIEKLFAKETGATVRKGEPLYELYSETLLTLQKEFILAKEQHEAFGAAEKRYASFLKSAEKKLLLYGLTQQQINRLSESKNMQPRITFLSPAAGVITAINAAEGQYVEEGSTLYKIENIKKLWLEAELYPSETSLIKTGDRIQVKVSGFENEPVQATVTFLSPEFRQGTQIAVMRGSVDNPEMKFKAGMQAQVFLTHSSRKALAIPVDAVIRSENGMHVYIQTGRNSFRPQRVKTGVEDFTQVEITEGLNEGDTVAVTGAYLLYSEIILKKGSDPMQGHLH